MAYEPKTNTGSLFRNDRKEKESQPDYRGSVNIDGKKLEISAWIRKTKDGSKSYLGLTFKPPYEKEPPF